MGPFRVGEQPADALDLVVSREADAAPLSGFTSVEIQIRRPDRTITASSASLVQPDTVRTAWPANPFTQSGLYRVRAKLIGSGSVLEYTSWTRFWVRESS